MPLRTYTNRLSIRSALIFSLTKPWSGALLILRISSFSLGAGRHGKLINPGRLNHHVSWSHIKWEPVLALLPFPLGKHFNIFFIETVLLGQSHCQSSLPSTYERSSGDSQLRPFVAGLSRTMPRIYRGC